jgi:head-tail adaptor
MGVVGKMDRKIEIMTPVKTKSSQGATINTFAHLCYRYASRMPEGNSPESFQNNRLTAITRYRYKLNVTLTINETMRLIDDTLIYNILEVRPEPDNKLFIEILAERVME